MIKTSSPSSGWWLRSIPANKDHSNSSGPVPAKLPVFCASIRAHVRPLPVDDAHLNRQLSPPLVEKLAKLTEKNMNKRILLVLTCALFLAFAGLQGFAQSNADQAAPQAAPQAGSQTMGDPSQAAAPDTQAKVQAKLHELSSELNLTDDQKTQLKPILQ